MPNFKSLLIGLEVVVAGKLRKCYHSKKHSIQKGEECLEVRDGLARKGYCLPCANEMLAEACQRLADVRQKIEQASS